MIKSIEEQIEDLIKNQLHGTKYYTKNENINKEIDLALKNYPSKQGGSGGNFPDIKLFLETKYLRKIPVMIEIKGMKGCLVKLTKDGYIDNYKKDGSKIYKNISKYATNGAIHYANAILEFSSSFNEVIAVGVNGYYDNGTLINEILAYYINKKNNNIPKLIGKYHNIEFLKQNNIDNLINTIDALSLTQQELENKLKTIEINIENKLKQLNDIMHNILDISVQYRISLITGLIIASFGVPYKISPIDITDFKGDYGQHSNDGVVVLNKISDFLNEKCVPNEKKQMIINNLSNVFLLSNLYMPFNGESKIKTVYTFLKQNIMQYFFYDNNLDFTGKLFNVLNEWVDIPDGAENDVVLTPRYITDTMAKLAQVNMNSYVWDFAVGTGGFLISSMQLMINDATTRINDKDKLIKKIEHIKQNQLLGIEKLPDIYLLAILNMFLAQDGSSNIIHTDSLTYTGNYKQGELKGQKYPANVFLLNPPYSADGKGFIFVQKALEKMQNGKAVILIQENAGAGQGLPYTTNILENNTLVASIHMPNIFKGKAGVQTAIYVFDVGVPHNIKKVVKFIDFSNDGYMRQYRKKSNQEVNLKNVDHANERYDELINLVLYGKNHLKYFTENEYIEDYISLSGDDWTFAQHKQNKNKLTDDDFKNVIEDYLSWKITKIIKED